MAQDVVKSEFEYDHKINCSYDYKSRANLREGSRRKTPWQTREQREGGKVNSRLLLIARGLD